jgi:RimJ/RimL family protein N-acetyltransferase
MTLRPARASDARRLWRWANDPDARRASIQGGRIAWATHRRWFQSRLADVDGVRLFIVQDPGPVAIVRFESSVRGRAIVSITVAPEARGRKVATRALRLACPRAARELKLRRLWAYVKESNPASIALFRKAGFRTVRRERREGAQVFLFTKAQP